jgi:erythronate-4-phosphate dehydrogenase
MRIRLDENIPLGPEVFGPHGEVSTFAGRNLGREDVLDADALIVRSVTRVDAALLDGSRVRFVGTATIGTDHVDQGYLRDRGIGFASAPGCNANSVGDYVTAALLHLRRTAGLSLEGKTLGIIGYGNVGRRVAAKAPALGLRVVKCDPPLAASSSNPGEFLPLEALLERSDVVTLHVPLVRQGPHPTLRMADAAFFARLTRPIVFLNTCRGEVVSEPDLLAAREAGKVERMVLDVFAGEPRIDPTLCEAADLVTPHIAGYSVEGKVGGTFQVAEAFRRHFSLPEPVLPPWPAPADPVLPYPDPGGPPAAGGPHAADGQPQTAGLDEAFLHAAVRRAYDIAADDARLRAALREPEPAKAFDRLRREYPVRHEFLAYRVAGLPEDGASLRSRLQGLGFHLD